jgi:hypothetical protein
MLAGRKKTAAIPFLVPVRFELCRFKAFGEFTIFGGNRLIHFLFPGLCWLRHPRQGVIKGH